MSHQEAIKEGKREAYNKAIDNLARYKFNNFGYWAAWWVKLNQMDGKEPNPFKPLVDIAKELRDGTSDRGQ